MPLQPLHHPVNHCPAMIVGMGFIGHFSLWLVDQRPYWHSGYFGGMLFGGRAAGCAAPGSAKVEALP